MDAVYLRYPGIIFLYHLRPTRLPGTDTHRASTHIQLLDNQIRCFFFAGWSHLIDGVCVRFLHTQRPAQRRHKISYNVHTDGDDDDDDGDVTRRQRQQWHKQKKH